MEVRSHEECTTLRDAGGMAYKEGARRPCVHAKIALLPVIGEGDSWTGAGRRATRGAFEETY